MRDDCEFDPLSTVDMLVGEFNEANKMLKATQIIVAPSFIWYHQN